MPDSTTKAPEPPTELTLELLKNNMVPFCFKLKKQIRDQFKVLTHKKKSTMQNVLCAFVELYVRNPDQFIVKKEMVVHE